MTTVLDRFLRYVRYDTRSDDGSASSPSTPGQMVFQRDLVSELRAIGLADADVDANGYVMATVPATTRKTSVPPIGFIAHVDTSPEMSGAGVKPIVHGNYQGQDLVLPDDPAIVLRLADNPPLADQIGNDIVTASGTTLLGDGRSLPGCCRREPCSRPMRRPPRSRTSSGPCSEHVAAS